MARQYRYDYYRVDVPEEIGDEEERARIAFLEAEEQTRIYALPCEWSIRAFEGDTVIVRRKRFAKEGIKCATPS